MSILNLGHGLSLYNKKKQGWSEWQEAMIYIKEKSQHCVHLSGKEGMEGGQTVSIKFSGINYNIISLTAY